MAYFEKYLEVKRSSLPKSGKGLFTKTFIKKGKRIVEYKGNIVKWKDVKYKDATNGYFMYISANVVIDAKPSKTFGRYANDAKGASKINELKNNATYACVGNRCFIEAKRDILPGEEIFVGYGKAYWDLDKETKRSQKRKKTKTKSKAK